ncbi:MAG: PIN domain-containing protein [Oculatellaceae cyanobacterium bins.114]|nr:PIN domain-containing protein [Oculatellaceae cyanobacterium bins.114]
MAAIPPVILVLDIGALSSATPREWLEFSRVGSCIVPQVVYEEMKFLFDRSPDPDLERIARAFNRFYATSGWQISEATAHHAVLKSGSGQALTRRSRISLAVGKCSYALSQEHPASLVVLVSSDRSMLQRIYDIQANNLCAITGPALLQWCRTGQRPIAVSQKLQRLRVATGAQVNSAIQGQPYPSGAPSRITTTTPSRVTSTTRITSGKKTTIQEASSMPSWIPQAFSLATSLAALAIAGLILFNVFRSTNFQHIINPSHSAPTQSKP